MKLISKIQNDITALLDGRRTRRRPATNEAAAATFRVCKGEDDEQRGKMVICQIPYLMDFKIPPHADGIENPLFEGIHSHLQIPILILKPNQTQESLGI